ncbi:thioesterase [Corynebacterium diphtheriae]|nr:thioesterase [Corynebacterium diphtheriae]
MGNMSNNDEIMELLKSANVEGLSIEQLEEFNEKLEGFSKTLGLRFTQINSEGVHAELLVAAEHLQVSGVVNGGVYSAMAETAGSIASVVAADGAMAVGVHCATDFLGMVHAGVIDVSAEIIHRGRTTHVVAVDMHHRGKLVARATLRTLLVAPQPEKPQKDKMA